MVRINLIGTFKETKHQRYNRLNRDKVRAQNRESRRRARARNPETFRGKHRRWKAKNLDRSRELGRKAGAKWRAQNRETHNARTKAWAEANPEKVKGAKLKRLFGTTLDGIAAQIAKQDGRCPICRDQLRGGRYQHIDHDHTKPGTFRGVLCSECNTAIGKLRDDPEIIARAAEYVRKGGV